MAARIVSFTESTRDGISFRLEFGSGRHTTQEAYTVTGRSYHRNGVSGEGFHAVRFHRDTRPADELIGIIFDSDKHVAVIDPTNLDSHWRGDNFEHVLRKVVNQ